jgi:hypothetical protein
MNLNAVRDLAGNVYTIKHPHDELYSTVIVSCNQGNYELRAFSYSLGGHVTGSSGMGAATTLETNLSIANQVSNPCVWYGLEWTIPRIRPARFSTGTVRVDCTVPDEVIAEFAMKARIEVFSGGMDRARLGFIPGQREIRLSPIGASQHVWLQADHSGVTCGPNDMFFIRLSFPNDGMKRHDALECFSITFRLIEDPTYLLGGKETKPTAPISQAPEWTPPAWLTPHASQPVEWQVQPLPKIELPEPDVRAPGETSVVDFRRLDIGEEKP